MSSKKNIIETKSDEVLVILTNSYRIFGSTNFLDKRARNVNYVFNHINATAYDYLRKYSIWLSKGALQSMTTGVSKLTDKDFGFSFEIHSQTAQAIAHTIYDARKWTPNKNAKPVLNFRRKDDLGWIPFYPRVEDLTMPEKKKQYGYIRFLGRHFKFKVHRLLPETHKLCQSDFTQDNKGNWYVNITYQYIEKVKKAKHKAVGIDLNLTEEKQIVLSDGRQMSRVNLTKQKEMVTNKIHRKIYKIKYNEQQRYLLAKKKELNTLIYSDSSKATDDEKTSYKKEVQMLKEHLSVIWKENLKAITTKEKSKKIAKLNKLYKTLGKIEFHFKNKRKDHHHKVSREIADNYDEVYFGDGLNNGLSQTNMAASFQDIAPYQLRMLTKYKVSNNGHYCDVNVCEAGTTFTCNKCLEPTGPRGRACLSVREWFCFSCGIKHDRDLNSSDNILDVGQKKIEYDHKQKRMIRKVSSGTATLAKL